MYCFVSAIWRNSRVTALLSVSSTLESRLISPESVSISFSERLLKILADTSAPRLVRKMAAFLVPDSVSTSGDIGAASRGDQRLLLHHPRADQLGGGLGLGAGDPERLLAEPVALAAQPRELLRQLHARRLLHRDRAPARCRACRRRLLGLERAAHGGDLLLAGAPLQQPDDEARDEQE